MHFAAHLTLLSLGLGLAACGGPSAGPAGDPPVVGPVAPTATAPIEAPSAQPTEPPPAPTASTTSTSTEPAAPTPAAQSPGALVAAADGTRGGKLFEEMKCKGCHGTAAKPSTKFPKVFARGWDDKGLERAFRIIKKGESPMPGFEGKLDDAQIADILRFLQDG